MSEPIPHSPHHTHTSDLLEAGSIQQSCGQPPTETSQVRGFEFGDRHGRPLPWAKVGPHWEEAGGEEEERRSTSQKSIRVCRHRCDILQSGQSMRACLDVCAV